MFSEILTFYPTEVMEDLYNMVDNKTGNKMPMLGEHYYKIIMEHADKLNSAIIYDRDFSYNYFGFKVSNVNIKFKSKY